MIRVQLCLHKVFCKLVIDCKFTDLINFSNSMYVQYDLFDIYISDHFDFTILFYLQDQSGKIDINELRAVCQELKLPVNTKILESLLGLCDPNGDKQIDYVEFVNFLNWKDHLPTGFGKDPTDDEYENRILVAAKNSGVKIDDNNNGTVAADVLKNQIDLESDFVTSYLTYGAEVVSNTDSKKYIQVFTLFALLALLKLQKE